MSPFLLVVCLFFFFSDLKPLHSNKTYLRHRSQGSFLTLSHPLCGPLAGGDDSKNHGVLRVAPFGHYLVGRSDFARYFLFKGKKSLRVGRGLDIDNRHLKFNETSSTALSGELSLNPSVHVHGFVLQYRQTLTPLSDHVFFDLVAPIVHISHDLGLKVSGGTPSTSLDKRVEDYFAGDVMFEGTHDGTTQKHIFQQPLEFARITRASRHKTGPADLYVALGYSPSHSRKFHLDVILNCIIPTDNEAKSSYVFEPILGYGDHYGLGIGTQGLWKIKSDLMFGFNARYSYIFPEVERRVFGLKNASGDKLDWPQYMLLGRQGLSQVTPAANVLAKFTTVCPGSTLEGAARFIYPINNFRIEVGLSSFYRGREDVSSNVVWNENTYAFVGSDYAANIVGITSSNSTLQAASKFDVATASNKSNTVETMSASLDGGTGYITRSQLDPSAAETPEVWLNSIYGSTSYIIHHGKTDVELGVGCAYQHPYRNSGLASIAWWLNSDVYF
jgi:hypothetical protein